MDPNKEKALRSGFELGLALLPEVASCADLQEFSRKQADLIDAYLAHANTCPLCVRLVLAAQCEECQ